MRKFICLVFWLPLIVIAQDPARIQQADNFIYDGNEAFDASNSTEAEKNYRRALATGEKKTLPNTIWELLCNMTIMCRRHSVPMRM